MPGTGLRLASTAMAAPVQPRPGGRAHGRLARLRRQRRRAARRVRRLRAARASRRHRSRARDEGAAPARRGRRDRGARARAAARRGAVRALPRVRRLPLPGSGLRRAARGQGAVGRRLARAARGTRRPPARADRPRGLPVQLPQQDGVLVRAGRGRARRSACTAPGAGTRCSGSSSAGSRRDLGNADPQPVARLGAGGAAPGVRPGHAGGLPPPSRRARGPEHRARRSCSSSPRAASASTASA